MRPSYRLESVLCCLAAVLIALAVPVAAAFGTATYTVRLEESDRAAAGIRSVDATLDAGADSTSVALGVVAVPAHWTIGGSTHRDRVVVDHGAVMGSRIPIWVDPAGKQVPKPPTRAQAGPDAIALALGVFGVVTATVILAYQLARWLLDRRRQESWAREWAALADVRKWHYL